jgi:hypothetical protein
MVDNRMLNDYGTTGAIKIGRRNRNTRENLPQCHIVHHTAHMK